MTTALYPVRDYSDLPFYCKPVYLFLAVWGMMLAAFELRISYTSYPYFSLAVFIFVVSLCSFGFGYLTLRLSYTATGSSPSCSMAYTIDVARLRRFQLACFLVAVAILCYNLKQYGLPPVFGFFGADTFDYGEYGSLKQLLFPAFMALFVTAPLEPARLWRWCLYAFGPLCAFAYASRGYLLIMLFQLLIMFSLRAKMSKRRIYLIAFATLVAAVELSDVIGNSRSSYGSAALLGYMQIRHRYYDWPTSYLWLVSYVSSPISNLCWIIRSYPYSHPSMAFLYNLAPGFWKIKGLEANDLGSDNIVDGVHTYIAKYYLDFWWLGTFGINYMWGLISAHMVTGNRLARNFLTSSVLLSCLGFLFFADFLTFLLIVVELAILFAGHIYFTSDASAFGQYPGTAKC